MSANNTLQLPFHSQSSSLVLHEANRIAEDLAMLLVALPKEEALRVLNIIILGIFERVEDAESLANNFNGTFTK